MLVILINVAGTLWPNDISSLRYAGYFDKLMHEYCGEIKYFLWDMLVILKVIYPPLYGMNTYVLIWGDWLSCDPLRWSHDSQSPHIRKHLCPILWQL